MILAKFNLKLAANSKGIFDSDKLNLTEKTIVQVHSCCIIGIIGINELIISISTDNVLKISKCMKIHRSKSIH